LKIIAISTTAVILVLTFWIITSAKIPEFSSVENYQASLERGEYVFNASGCASCHSSPDATQAEKVVLTGGRSFPSLFGTFYAPNISMDKVNGIGDWSEKDFANALLYGVSPEGKHYYPSFPYSAYANMTDQDISDLWFYFKSIPESSKPSIDHDLPMYVRWRRPIALWKLLNKREPMTEFVSSDATEQRGAYLVETLGHCGECHTSRNFIGGLQYEYWLGGAKNPAGKGMIPNITPTKLTWDTEEIIEYLASGFTPDFDVAGGHMADVIENTSKLTEEDRLAIAEYLKAIPGVQK
jgi:mono/diheme cytochrome c family protein